MATPAQFLPHLWKPGQSGNPKGPPKGYRRKLEERFLKDLHDSWQERGNQAIEAAIEKDPVGYVKVVASLMPKRVDAENSLEGINRDELRTAIDALRAWFATANARSLRNGTSDAGQDQRLQTLPEAARIP